MIIGYEAKRVFHNRSGLGNYSRNLVRTLALHLPDHQYLLFNPKKGKVDFNESLPNVFEKRPHITNALYSNLWRQKLVSDRAAREGVEIFHGLSQELPSGLKSKGIRSVVTIHDLIFLRYPQLYKYLDRKIYIKKVRSACKQADLIVAISEQTKRDLVEFLRIPERKIKVVYQGAQPVFWQDRSEKEIEQVRKKYKLPGRFGLFVGTLEPRKNVDKLLEAQLKAEIPMVYIGKKTGFWKKMLNLPRYHNILDKVHQPQVDSNDELACIFRAADFMIYPSVFEGFGLPVLEAQICKTPVITSNVSSLPEVAGPSAILVEPGNQQEITEAMEKVWSSETLRQQMADSGFTFAENFKDEKIALTWDKIYKSLKS